MCVYIYILYIHLQYSIYIYIICILYRNVFQLLCPPLPLGKNSFFQVLPLWRASVHGRLT